MSTPTAEPRPRRRGGLRSADPARVARRRSLKDDALNLPNILTMARVVAIPLILWLIRRGTPKDCVIAASVYSAAAITDLLDGYLARKMRVVSVLGKFLDPLADKLLVMASLIWMVPMGRISDWAVVLLIGLRSIASTEGVVIAAGESGKSKTALQMVGILCLVIGYPYHLSLGFLDLGMVDLVIVGRWLIYVSLVFSVTSAVEYVGLFAQAVEAKERRQRES
jgi:CDP-diacylglycerol--glycerol-3-phosphate 3-phosphatidyltransferase